MSRFPKDALETPYEQRELDAIGQGWTSLAAFTDRAALTTAQSAEGQG